MPEFSFSAGEADTMIGKARQHTNLIIDLRGNPGGDVEALKYLVKIADRTGRKGTKPEIAKAAHNPFRGKLVVLVDSKSASAVELFARIVQLEKRGVVIGDKSAGAVTEARHYSEKRERTQ